MPKYYTQFENEYGLEVILENTDQEHPTIINQDAYRMFVARLIHINNKYYDRYADKTDPEYAKNRLVNYKTPFDIDIFYRMNHRWLSLAQEYYKTKDDPTGLKNISEKDKVHSFEPKHFDLIKQAATELFYDLSDIAEKNKFGTPYTDNNGKEQMDYTEVVDDILELSLLATHAYTDIFNVLENEKNYGSADKRMEELAYCMHNSHYSDMGRHLPVRSWVSGTSKRFLGSPNFALKTMFPGYSEENYLNRKLDPRFSPFNTESKKRTPEEEAKYQEEMAQLVEKAKEEERKKQEEIEREMREEGERLAAEEEERRRAQSEEERVSSLLARYADETKAVPFIPNEENPSKVNQAMYAYFDKFAERMGIDQSKFNAQSLIQASSIAFLTEYTRNIVEEGKPDIENKFLKDMVEIYKNVSHLTYDAYIQKCLKENTPIDFNVPSKEVLDLMGVAMYTMYPNVVNGEKIDDGITRNIAKVVNGYFASGAIKYDYFMRDDAIERAKLDYINNKDDAFFTVDAEARFEGFATRKLSSNDIVAETADIVNSYRGYKINRADPERAGSRTAFIEAERRKFAMDAAYALERRVETRYGSRLARFFRYFSYAKQRDELDRVKEVLGIPKDQRVAEHMKSSRINDLFVEANKKTVKELSDDRQKLVGNNPIKYLNKLLEKNLSKEDMPKITNKDMQEEEYNRVRKYEELTPAAIQRMKEAEEERLRQEEIRQENERKRKEEEERIRKEEEEKERIRKEEEERKRKEEEERKRKEEEERLRKEEEEKRRKEEERIRKEEEEKAYIRQQLADRAEAIQQHQETLNEREVRDYNVQLDILQEHKGYADKEYNEAKQADDENREKFQKELDEAIKRAAELKDQIVIQGEQAESDVSQYRRIQNDAEKRYEKRVNEIYANKKDKTLKKLLEAKAKEDEENATKQWSVARQHTAGNALKEYISSDPTLQSINLEIKTLDKQIMEARGPIAEMEYELSVLEGRIPELEKDLKRINHELEVATTVKKYVDNAIKYYTDNKEEIMSKYASAEIGRQLNMEIPYGKVEFYTTPIYETKVSDLKLEESDPEPMKKYIEDYDKTMHITEEMKQMAL